MKKIFIASLLFISLGFISCQKENAAINNESSLKASTSTSNNTIPTITVFSTCSTWGINSFIVNGVNMTNDYSPVKFDFCPDNSLNLYNDIMGFTGNWYFTLDKGNPQYLMIVIDHRNNPGQYWTNLEGNWKITSLQDDMIALQMEDALKTLVIERRSK